MAEKFLLKDHLFNQKTIGQLADEFAAGVPGFDAGRFTAKVLEGFASRELLQRLEWMADCLEDQLATDFPKMADQLEAAMPPRLSPDLGDDDFGHFIHATPGILAVRHGLEHHRDRALDLLHAATQRFSMEFYIRPFLNRWPGDTLDRLHEWARDPNYHVRRLVSEGTRPKLPWAKAVKLGTAQTVPLLDALHADPTRYVTRSVANHLNDIAKTEPDVVLDRLSAWGQAATQSPKELDWMRRHALRTLIKDGNPGAMSMLGFVDAPDTTAEIVLEGSRVAIGDALRFGVRVTTAKPMPVLVDYLLSTPSGNGRTRDKVFKLKTGTTRVGEPLVFHKVHKLKGDATTFRLFAGPARLAVQVNGRVVAQTGFDLVDAAGRLAAAGRDC